MIVSRDISILKDSAMNKIKFSLNPFYHRHNFKQFLS